MFDSEAIHVDIMVPYKKRYLSLVGNIAEALVRELDCYAGDRDILAFHLNLVLTEAMVNAIEHSNHSAKVHTAKVSISLEGDNLSVGVYDHGPGFDLDLVPIPDLEEPSERGRGIFLIRTLMDDVSYRKTAVGNILEMHKRLG